MSKLVGCSVVVQFLVFKKNFLLFIYFTYLLSILPFPLAQGVLQYIIQTSNTNKTLHFSHQIKPNDLH